MQKLYIISLLIIIALNTCSDNPVNPGDNIPPGRRDYVWTVDTIEIPFSTIRRMWGASPYDLWAIASAGDLDKTIYHYDGTRWTTDGIYRSIDPTSIYGFTANNIWLGGGDGKIWHFNDSLWNEFIVLNVVPGKGITFENIWGDSPSNVYAVGSYVDENGFNNNGVIAHFDGNLWKLLDIQINNSLTKIYKDIDGTYFVQGTRFGMLDTSKVFVFSNNSLTEIYSDMETDSYAGSISLIGDRVLISLGRNLYTYSNGEFKLFYTVNNPLHAGGGFGRNFKDIFLFAYDGILHFNGTNEKYLIQFNNINNRVTAAVILESEVFLSFYDLSNGKTYMYKGILSNNK